MTCPAPSKHLFIIDIYILIIDISLLIILTTMNFTSTLHTMNLIAFFMITFNIFINQTIYGTILIRIFKSIFVNVVNAYFHIKSTC